jgi:hypothetical protein
MPMESLVMLERVTNSVSINQSHIDGSRHERSLSIKMHVRSGDDDKIDKIDKIRYIR